MDENTLVDWMREAINDFNIQPLHDEKGLEALVNNNFGYSFTRVVNGKQVTIINIAREVLVNVENLTVLAADILETLRKEGQFQVEMEGQTNHRIIKILLEE